MNPRFKTSVDWNPPDNWTRITCIDAHTEGEPFRVITGGFPDLPGDTILARRRYAKEHYDHLRTALMWEPRGHADMYGCIVTPPVSPNADIGILFIHNEGYSTMCGHGIIGITTVALETGMLPMTEPETTISIDSPAGLVTAHARVSNGRVKSVYFYNVPSFVLAKDQVINVPELTFAANQINNRLLTKPFEVFFILAMIYFVVCWTLTQLANWLERRIAAKRAGGGGTGGTGLVIADDQPLMVQP